MAMRTAIRAAQAAGRAARAADRADREARLTGLRDALTIAEGVMERNPGEDDSEWREASRIIRDEIRALIIDTLRRARGPARVRADLERE